MAVARDADALRERVLDGGFTPSVRDVPALLDLLGEAEDASAVLRALTRVIEAAVPAAMARFDGATAVLRARLVELVGRAARTGAADVAWLRGRLDDPDAVVRRRAAAAIGKLEDPQHEPVLLAAWSAAQSDPERKVIAAALGQCGSTAALALLGAVRTDDAELGRVVRESVLKLERTLVRATPSTISLDALPSEPIAIELQVRPGLESFVCAAIEGAKARARGLVTATWSRSLRELFAVRTFIDVAMPLPPVRLVTPTPSAVEDAVVRALAGDAVGRILATFTAGPVRWRLDWRGQGHRRGSTWRVVEALALLRPELVNDPRDAPWEAAVSIDPEARVDQLGLELMSRNNGTRHETAFTTSIEAREGVTTGISAADRARTVSVAIDASKGRDDIVTPGHVFPLIARDGGVLVRAGHTEASVDIARLAGLNPSGVICEIMNDDGSMARLDDLIPFARRHGLKIGTIADLIAYRSRTDRLVECVADEPFESDYGGEWRLKSYRNKVDGTVNLVLQKGLVDPEGVTLVRMHPVSIFDDIMGRPGARKRRLQRSMDAIGEAGSGVIVMLMRPLPGSAAADALPPPAGGMDLRTYGIGAQILVDLGVHAMELLTPTHSNLVGLEGYGLSIVGERSIPGETE